MLRTDVTCRADFVFLDYTGHIFRTPSMILSFLRAVSSWITSRSCCMDCAFSMPWSRSDAHLGPWDGTFHMSSMRWIYASVHCSYTCCLMNMRYVSGNLVLTWLHPGEYTTVKASKNNHFATLFTVLPKEALLPSPHSVCSGCHIWHSHVQCYVFFAHSEHIMGR